MHGFNTDHTSRNGWRKAARESLDPPEERLREMPLQDPGLNAFGFLRICMEEKEPNQL
jgi:hypothetical protein